MPARSPLGCKRGRGETAAQRDDGDDPEDVTACHGITHRTDPESLDIPEQPACQHQWSKTFGKRDILTRPAAAASSAEAGRVPFS
jgi:hypothetical protein